MTSAEAVLLAHRMLLDRHKDAIAQSDQVNIGLSPKYGHGDDIWVRIEHIHIVAEVTIIGSGGLESSPRGGRRTELKNKVRKLNARQGVTHKYLFVAENYAAWFDQREDLGDVQILSLPGS